jgi:hypothetical protein
VFLIGRQRRSVAQIERLARNALEVGLVGDERTDGDGRRDEVSAFEVHAPARGLVGETGAQRHAYLPVDVDVGVGEYLRFARHGRSEHQGAESDGFEVFRCFHNRTIFCC